ncbi:MAG TPA: hypothetical protein VMT35_12075 [Ignavibacteriaceae bacterium]|nr:hypothetical protein [Ignavibacteriaceae bacterium]
MKIAVLIYHDVFDDRVAEILECVKIEAYTKLEQATGKFEGSEPHLGTRTYPGHESVRLIPIRDDERLNKLITLLEEFNKSSVKSADQIRLYSLPLERIV